MPIGYALLLCFPIGFVFFLMARFCFRHIIGQYERSERRAAVFIGLFGAFLIPTVWINGFLTEEFPSLPSFAISYSLFLVEGLVFFGLYRLSDRSSKHGEREGNEREEP